MADQDEVTQGEIPPKVSPFAKPEGASPMTPAAPGAPRPITVRLKPVGSPTDQVPNVAPQAPAAAAPAVGIPAAPPVNPRSTARVPVPESVAAAAPSAIRPMTVRLRPVAQPAQSIIHTPGSTQSIAKVETLSPSATVPVPVESVISPSATVQVPVDSVISPARQPQPPPTPGSHPLTEAVKPPSAAQVQAAKSKTSRISLDSAIGVAPVSDKDGPKTIRLKRPSDLSTPAAPTVQKGAAPSAAMRQTSRIPDSALPTAESPVVSDSSAVTQKKTLKIKRPSAAKEEGAAAEGEAFPEGVQMTPLSPMDFPAQSESSVFTTISAVAAIAATLVLVGLAWCLAAHAIGPGAGKNALASIKLGGVELPWAGRLN